MDEHARGGDTREHNDHDGQMHRIRLRFIVILCLLALISIVVTSRVRPNCPLISNDVALTFVAVDFTAAFLLFVWMFLQLWRGRLDSVGIMTAVAALTTVDVVGFAAALSCKDVHLICFVGVAAGFPAVTPLVVLSRRGRISARAQAVGAVLLAVFFAAFVVVAVGVVARGGSEKDKTVLGALFVFCALLIYAAVDAACERNGSSQEHEPLIV